MFQPYGSPDLTTHVISTAETPFNPVVIDLLRGYALDYSINTYVVHYSLPCTEDTAWSIMHRVIVPVSLCHMLVLVTACVFLHTYQQHAV